MTQNCVRERLNKYISEKGVSQKFICNRISLPTCIMSQFKKGKKDLFEEHLNQLDSFLKQENY